MYRHRNERAQGWKRYSQRRLRFALPATLARARILGPLPSFLVIGTQRGGTTYLHDLLLDHPSVASALVKEVHFFSRHFDRGLGWYRANFAPGYVASWRPGSGRRIGGEATADYLFFPCVPQRIQQSIPEVKLIALLRDPVDRAYSHYQLSVRNGVESLSFEDALQAESERLGLPIGQTWPDAVQLDLHQVHHSYVTKGLYAHQLRRWMKLFPMEQLLIVNSERLYAQTQIVLDEVADFLELRQWQPVGQKNTNGLPYSSMRPETRRTLVDFYRPYNQELYELLGTSFDWDAEPLSSERRRMHVPISSAAIGSMVGATPRALEQVREKGSEA